MNWRLLCALTLSLFALSSSLEARAQQARDWMVAAQLPGTRVNLDLVYPGVQVALEHRENFYGRANQLTLRASELLTLAFSETQLDADMRVVVLTFGASVGVHSDFRYLSFQRGEVSNRAARREQEHSTARAGSTWSYLEGRAALSLPFNDHLVLQSVFVTMDGAPADSIGATAWCGTRGLPK